MTCHPVPKKTESFGVGGQNAGSSLGDGIHLAGSKKIGDSVLKAGSSGGDREQLSLRWEPLDGSMSRSTVREPLDGSVNRRPTHLSGVCTSWIYFETC